MINLKKICSNNLFMLSYVFKYVPLYAYLSIIIETIAIVLTNIINVFAVKYIIDIFQNGQPFNKVLLFILVLLGISVLVKLLVTYVNVAMRPIAAEVLSQKIQMELFGYIMEIPVLLYDNPDFYNDFLLTSQQAEDRAIQVFDTIKDMIKYFFVMLMFIIFSLIVERYGIIFVGVSTAISIISNLYIQKTNYKHFLELIPLLRKREYYSKVLREKDYSKELKLTSIRKKIVDYYLDVSEKIKKNFKFYFERYYIPINIFDEFVGNNFLISILYSSLIAYKTVVEKSMNIGTFSALMTSVWSLNAVLLNFSNTIILYAGHSEFVEKLRKNIDLYKKNEKKNKLEKLDEILSVSIRNGSFKYNELDKFILSNINFNIKQGEKAVILGKNGSGKSTLIKLIAGLYEVGNGEVLINGININRYEKKTFCSKIACLFQDYQIYSYSLAENVKLDTIENTDIPRILECLEYVGFDKDVLNNIDKDMSNRFSNTGLNLSGGEEQKIALARVLFRNSSFILLDEPLTKMDIFNNAIIDEMFSDKSKTVIVVTHDLSQAIKADKICLLENGEIVEQGTHEELLKNDGKYATYWKTQAGQYTEVN